MSQKSNIQFPPREAKQFHRNFLLPSLDPRASNNAIQDVTSLFVIALTCVGHSLRYSIQLK
jgi:hypothetical protein